MHMQWRLACCIGAPTSSSGCGAGSRISWIMMPSEFNVLYFGRTSLNMITLQCFVAAVGGWYYNNFGQKNYPCGLLSAATLTLLLTSEAGGRCY
jgi:hypothetical protein